MEKQRPSRSSGSTKVKLLCSYGGRIQPRPAHHQLAYIGGETKILAVDRHISFSEMAARLMILCNRSGTFEVSIKYQLPGEDLDALVSLINDEDVEHMMVEYARMKKISGKPARLRIFIFDKSRPAQSGGKEPGPNPPLNPDYLFGFDKEYCPSTGPPVEFLQTPDMLPFDRSLVNNETAQNYGTTSVNNVNSAENAAAAYRLAADAGGFQGGHLMYGMMPVPEQYVYSAFPIKPWVPGQKKMVSTGKDQSPEINQLNF